MYAKKKGQMISLNVLGKLKCLKKYLSWSFINKFQNPKQKFKLIPK